MHGWSPRVMRSNSGHSIVEAKMLDFQVLIFVTSFWVQPTHSTAGLLLQVFQIRASDTPTVRWNRGMQFDCRLGPGTSHWQLLHKRLRFRGTHTMNFFAPTHQSIFCDMAGMSTAIQFTHTISKNSHFSGRPWNGFVQSGAIPTQNLKSFWSLCESSNFWTSVTIFVACARGLNVAVAHSINTGVKVLVFHPYGIILQMYCFWAQIEAQRPTFNSKMALTKVSACGAAVLYIRNLIMLERMVDRCR